MLNDSLEKDFKLKQTVAIPNWPGASDSLTLWRRRWKDRQADARNIYVKWPKPTVQGHPPEAEEETRKRRADALEAINSSWASAAAAHISARRLQGGDGAANAAERRLVEEACRRAPLLRGLMLRLLCR